MKCPLDVAVGDELLVGVIDWRRKGTRQSLFQAI